DGFDPLLMQVNTSSEYWQKAASLLTTDPLGQHDVALPENARAYLLAGTQHTGAAGRVADRGPCVHPRNPHSPGPALRALLHALREWACAGVAPPPSSVPRIADGTAVPAERLGFPALPGVAVARAANVPERIADWVHARPAVGPQVVPLVPRVDEDGNEVAGVLLPDIAVPLGTHTGWNLYRAPYPECELCDRDGSFLAFARTRVERTQSGDPRLSLQERYGSPEAYVQRVAAAVEALLRQRLLLPEDASLYVEAARARRLWD
ncbi:MAG TPA: alpha/beta hydrolase domain-containing protein, partial [bacterium]|nr:alpha/beta hydrolase domain-containing protein [bacterium]